LEGRAVAPSPQLVASAVAPDQGNEFEFIDPDVFCPTAKDVAVQIQRTGDAQKGNLTDRLTEFRMNLDKCDQRTMASDEVCSLFSKFPRPAVDAFRPVYGGAWDGWGLWIKAQCIPRVLSSQTASATVLNEAVETIEARIKQVLPYEATGSLAGVEDATVKGVILDGLATAGKSPEKPADLPMALDVAEAHFDTIKLRVRGAMDDLVQSREVLAKVICRASEQQGHPITERECRNREQALLDEAMATQLQLAREENYNGTGRALIKEKTGGAILKR
jgi:hypothetical protein